jgi:dihydrolipoamide dehydrogenase
VAVVEKRTTFGGTCLNVGCIPSKALLQSSHLFEEAGHDLAVHGIKVAPPTLDFAQFMKRKAEVVEATTRGVAFLFRKNRIASFQGTGRIEAAGSVAVVGEDGAIKETLTAKNILIASGSEVTPLPGVTIDEKKIVSSTGALELTEVPKRLVVVGAGIIGLELGSVWRRLGSDVTVIEFLDRITPGVDDEITRHFQRALARQGLKFRLGSRVTKAEIGGTGIALDVEPAKGGAAETVEADVVLVSIGRRPHVEGLGLDKAGVKLTPRGRIEVDAHFQTSVPGIYAIGDVIDGPMLAHKASEDGVACVETIAGQKGHVNWDLVPTIIYTQPEVAWVGKTEEQLKAAGVAYRIGKYPFTADPRSRANGATEGFVKVLADKATDQVLGVHIIGAEAGTMIAEAAMAMEFSASAEDIGRVCHAHPTVNEALKEAALAAWEKPIHL